MSDLDVPGATPTADSIEAPHRPSRERIGREPFARLRSSDAATAAFVVSLAMAGPVLAICGRKRWFIIDDWDFLSHRTAGSLDDLLRSHESHWVTLPALAYRALWTVFGIRSYLPYQLVVIALHLAVASSLWALMRRTEVTPWLATVIATIFLFLGSCTDGFLSAFQMTLVGSVAFGFACLLLATYSSQLCRRDVLGVLAGLAAIMCSGVGVPMVAAACVAVWLRRGFRVSAFYAAFLGGVYGAWFLKYGRSKSLSSAVTGARQPPKQSSASSLLRVIRYVWSGLYGTAKDLGHLQGFQFVFLVLFAVGLASALLRPRRNELALGAASGALVFLLLAAIVRSGPLPGSPQDIFGSHVVPANTGRYVYVVAALILPTIALGIQALARRWRLATAVVGVALLVSFVGNAGELRHGKDFLALREVTAESARLPLLEQFPPSSILLGSLIPVRLGWLVGAAHAGKLPSAGQVAPSTEANLTLRILLENGTARTAQQHGCRKVSLSAEVAVPAGGVLTIAGGHAVIAYVPPSGPPSRAVELSQRSLRNPTHVTVHFRITMAGGTNTARVCRGGVP